MSIKGRYWMLYGLTAVSVAGFAVLTWNAAMADAGAAMQLANIWQRVAATIMGIMCTASIVVAVQVPMFNCWRAGYEAGREQRATERKRPDLRLVRELDA